MLSFRSCMVAVTDCTTERAPAGLTIKLRSFPSTSTCSDVLPRGISVDAANHRVALHLQTAVLQLQRSKKLGSMTQVLCGRHWIVRFAITAPSGVDHLSSWSFGRSAMFHCKMKSCRCSTAGGLAASTAASASDYAQHMVGSGQRLCAAFDCSMWLT